MAKSHTLPNKTFDEVGERRDAVHPFPPVHLSVRLHDTTAIVANDISQVSSNTAGATHNAVMNEKRELKMTEPMTGLGDIAATA